MKFVALIKPKLRIIFEILRISSIHYQYFIFIKVYQKLYKQMNFYIFQMLKSQIDQN